MLSLGCRAVLKAAATEKQIAIFTGREKSMEERDYYFKKSDLILLIHKYFNLGDEVSIIVGIDGLKSFRKVVYVDRWYPHLVQYRDANGRIYVQDYLDTFIHTKHVGSSPPIVSPSNMDIAQLFHALEEIKVGQR